MAPAQPGSLGLSHYPALAPMDLVTTVGTLGSLLAALMVIPALYTLLSTRRSQATAR